MLQLVSFTIWVSVLRLVCVSFCLGFLCCLTQQWLIKKHRPGWSTAAGAGLFSACLHLSPVLAGSDGSSAARTQTLRSDIEGTAAPIVAPGMLWLFYFPLFSNQHGYSKLLTLHNMGKKSTQRGMVKKKIMASFSSLICKTQTCIHKISKLGKSNMAYW